MTEPMAYAVMWSDSEFDYRVFPNLEEAEGFVSDLPLEEGDDEPEIVPLFAPTDQLTARAPDALREAAEKAIKLMHHLEDDLKEYKNSDTAIVFQHASDYADRLHHAADALAEAIE